MQVAIFQHGRGLMVNARLLNPLETPCFVSLRIDLDEIAVHVDSPEELVYLGDTIARLGRELEIALREAREVAC